MEKIQHKFVDVRGLELHVAEIGTGPVVVFLHGFPEIWYSWQYQMIAVANAGFRAIAPDFRSYGLSQQPNEPEKTTFRDNPWFIWYSQGFHCGEGFRRQISSSFCTASPWEGFSCCNTWCPIPCHQSTSISSASNSWRLLYVEMAGKFISCLSTFWFWYLLFYDKINFNFTRVCYVAHIHLYSLLGKWTTCS